jgi:hypothetical protein
MDCPVQGLFSYVVNRYLCLYMVRVGLLQGRYDCRKLGHNLERASDVFLNAAHAAEPGATS